MTDQQRDAVAAVLGRTPSGLFILTVRAPDGSQTGMLASWVQQASFDPPAVSVAIKKGRYHHEWLNASPEVVLNLLGESHKQFLGHFARGFDPEEEAFQGLKVQTAANGLTVLAEALGWLEGRVTGHIDAGDHVLYVVTITGAGLGPDLERERPWVHIRKSGFNY